MQVNHYLNFSGQAEAAFVFYQSVFGGALSHFMRYKEAPLPEWRILPEEENYVMHVALPITPTAILMGSDVHRDAPRPVVVGNHHAICLNLTDEVEARRLYNQLSAHGVVETPLQATFWDALYGCFIDQFGVKWMINCENYRPTLPI